LPIINENFGKLTDNYLFSEVRKRTEEYIATHLDKVDRVIRLGIGDVTLPLARNVVDALKKSAEEMAHAETFRGYGPKPGYPFVRQAVADYYWRFGVTLEPDTIFTSGGTKGDSGNITELFGPGNIVLIQDPVYPVYVDSNIMAGNQVEYLEGTAENGFLPMPDPKKHADIIYLCSPNNPTGACYDRTQLKVWVDYAIDNHAVILFDGVYEAFIEDAAMPHSIYEVEGAEKCAIEFGSLSKTAGFTGTRFGYTVIPKALKFKISDGRELSLGSMWSRRQSTKSNGTSYIIQRAAQAALSEEGIAQCMENIQYYKENAKIITAALARMGIRFFGGVYSPYIWMECPGGMDSWSFFDLLLEQAQVVGTPGEGFGKNGKGFFRLTAFGSRETTQEAMRRLEDLFAGSGAKKGETP
jgi:LL-diaminopimelate aminotransferase